MNTTKSKILAAALSLFNKNGFVNVRLQHIADEAFISVGNLAYHFPNKESIISALYSEVTKKQKDQLAESRVVPLFENIDRLIQESFTLQSEYIFFYQDTLEITRAYPNIANAHQHYVRSQVNQFLTIILFNSSRGAFHPEQIEGVFKQLALQFWMTLDLWTVRQAIIAEPLDSLEDYRSSLWNLLIPHFTKMGRQEYEQMLAKPYEIYF